ESADELLLSYVTISILRPITPPLALISSAAICAPPGVAAPAIDCTSAITPILIGSLDWAKAGVARHRASAEASGNRAPVAEMERCRDMLVSLYFYCS